MLSTELLFARKNSRDQSYLPKNLCFEPFTMDELIELSTITYSNNNSNNSVYQSLQQQTKPEVIAIQNMTENIPPVTISHHKNTTTRINNTADATTTMKTSNMQKPLQNNTNTTTNTTNNTSSLSPLLSEKASQYKLYCDQSSVDSSVYNNLLKSFNPDRASYENDSTTTSGHNKLIQPCRNSSYSYNQNDFNNQLNSNSNNTTTYINQYNSYHNENDDDKEDTIPDPKSFEYDQDDDDLEACGVEEENEVDDDESMTWEDAVDDYDSNPFATLTSPCRMSPTPMSMQQQYSPCAKINFTKIDTTNNIIKSDKQLSYTDNDNVKIKIQGNAERLKQRRSIHARLQGLSTNINKLMSTSSTTSVASTNTMTTSTTNSSSNDNKNYKKKKENIIIDYNDENDENQNIYVISNKSVLTCTNNQIKSKKSVATSMFEKSSLIPVLSKKRTDTGATDNYESKSMKRTIFGVSQWFNRK